MKISIKTKRFSLATRDCVLTLSTYSNMPNIKPQLEWNGGCFGYNEVIHVGCAWLRWDLGVIFHRPGSRPQAL